MAFAITISSFYWLMPGGINNNDKIWFVLSYYSLINFSTIMPLELFTENK